MTEPTQNDLERLRDMLAHFKTAMLVTREVEVGLRARPLSIAKHDDDGTLWFFTSAESGKVLEILLEDHVAVVMQDERRFVSLSGCARLDASLERRKELWHETFRPWFPEGAEDPTAIAIEFVPASGDIWDLSGANAVGYVFHAVRALVTGKRADDVADGRIHVRW